MAAAAERFYRANGASPRTASSGLAVARHGYGAQTQVIRMVEAGHPVPDEAGLAATRDALALAEAAGPDDLVLVLLSGGGSANWIAPAGDLTLAEKQGMTRALLRSGAAIGEINTRPKAPLAHQGRAPRAARQPGRGSSPSRSRTCRTTTRR